jgi:NADP-dependent aldehyde dehydrogenase
VKLSGHSLIGFQTASARGRTFYAFDPKTGERLEPAFCAAAPDDVDRAVELAVSAFESYRRISGPRKARLLKAIAAGIEAQATPIAARAVSETALPEARIASETARTCNQLRLFADLVEEGSWVDARIDHADPAREPVPRPDVRSMLRPLGPVAVFGASNFPLAFSVAGGDSASALAAGNPVVVKAHPAHPGTSESVGRVILDAVRECGLPEGLFSLLFDDAHAVGQALVRHAGIKAVGFTGSGAGGRALMDLAAGRPEPIPVYAEMGSVNPIFVLPGAAGERGEAIAQGIHTSLTLGVGQFCTNPGVVITGVGKEYGAFAQMFGRLVAKSIPGTMLTAGICAGYKEGVGRLAGHAGVKLVVAGNSDAGGAGKTNMRTCAVPTLFETDAETFLGDPSLMQEVFGPATLVVCCRTQQAMLNVARSFEGQLTATIHGTADELQRLRPLIDILETKAGRLVYNGFPTGVEVCASMVHGGPYPASSDGRTSSVGTRAIRRFSRAVAYQDAPDTALPEELRESNPLGIWRLVDGELVHHSS